MISGKLIFPALTLLAFVAIMLNGLTPIVTLILALAVHRLVIQKDSSLLVITMLVILVLGLRYIYFLPKETSLDLTENEEIYLIVKETSWKVDGNKLTLEGIAHQNRANEEVKVVYRIKNQEEKEQLNERIPEAISVKGLAKIPEGPSNFSQFDYPMYLKSKNIFCVLEATELVTLENNKKEKPLIYVLDSLRQRVLSHIDRTMTSQSSVYAKTLLFADKRTFKSDIMDSYKELGIIHLLSISGLHVSFLISLIRYLLLIMRVSKDSVDTALLFGLPFYGIVTGFGISVSRALGQVWFKLFLKKLSFSMTALDSWSSMLIITLLIQPYSLYTISFQLSYLISFIIIMFSGHPLFERLTKIQAYVIMNGLLLLSSIPILSYHFYGFSWGVLLLNSVFIPLVASLLLPLLLIIFVFSLLMPHSQLYHFMLYVTDKLIQFIELTAIKTSSNLNFNIITGRLSPLFYCFLVIFIMLLFIVLEKNRFKKYIIFPLLGILVCIYSVRYSPFGQVLLIDVGQGEAILIKEPWGKGNYLIDTGGQIAFKTEVWEERERKFNVGERIVLPVLKSEGVHKLESLIITHADIDHYGGMLGIIDQLPTKYVISSRETFMEENFQSLFPSIESYGTIIKEVVEDSDKYLPTNTYPLLFKGKSKSVSKNNNSLVLYGLIGEKTWLFTGDLEVDGEKSLLIKYPNMSVDILKVAHHGSHTSTHDALLEQINPETALISSGESNRHGHPHDSVVKKLIDHEISIYRTDTNGAVKYRYSNGSPIVNINNYLFSFKYVGKQRGE